MKPHLAAAAGILLAASVHAQTETGRPVQPLRVLLRQPSATATTTTPPRQLSSQERADLRRQLAQYSRAPAKGP